MDCWESMLEQWKFSINWFHFSFFRPSDLRDAINTYCSLILLLLLLITFVFKFSYSKLLIWIIRILIKSIENNFIHEKKSHKTGNFIWTLDLNHEINDIEFMLKFVFLLLFLNRKRNHRERTASYLVPPKYPNIQISVEFKCFLLINIAFKRSHSIDTKIKRNRFLLEVTQVQVTMVYIAVDYL